MYFVDLLRFIFFLNVYFLKAIWMQIENIICGCAQGNEYFTDNSNWRTKERKKKKQTQTDTDTTISSEYFYCFKPLLKKSCPA